MPGDPWTGKARTKRGHSPLRGFAPFALLALGIGVAAGAVRAQEPPVDIRRELQDSQRRLEQIREERARLQREMEQIRSRVRNVSGELQNIERQLSASHSVLAEIEFQVDGTAAQVQGTTGALLRAREEYRERQAILNRRLRDIYKRGPMHTTRVLLGADSFSDLLNRYRYLQMITSYDRALVANMRALEEELEAQSRELQIVLGELGRLRESKLSEVAELRLIEQEHQRALSQFRTQERQTMSRLDQLEADEVRMTGLITDLERRRLEEERRAAVAGAPAPGAASLSVADMGSLDWPVEGEILYRFGIDRRPNGTVLRWNGLGIRAAPGTPVQAVRGGTVALAGPFEGYGPTVIVSHGGGFYTLYLYLEEVGVIEGRQIATGQTVGTVGGRATPEGPHLEFQIRAPVAGGGPQAMDPLRWLRAR